jgi:hypothetical protein
MTKMEDMRTPNRPSYPLPVLHDGGVAASFAWRTSRLARSMSVARNLKSTPQTDVDGQDLQHEVELEAEGKRRKARVEQSHSSCQVESYTRPVSSEDGKTW